MSDKIGEDRRRLLLGGTALAALGVVGLRGVQQAQAQTPSAGGKKPNILVMWGDDIGIANISAYSGGLMGYETPNIDRIAHEGIKLQHYYGEQSCTAGRAAFNLMQDPFERADITSNTFWDWQLDDVGGVYGAMDEVFQFVATFKDFPPRSVPPSFNPANIMESTLDGIKEDRRLKQQLDLDRIRGGLNRMIDQELQEGGRR